MRQYYILAFVLLASFSSLSLAQSGSRDCERPLAGEQISDFGLRTESEFEIEVKLSDTDLIDSLKVLLSQDFPDKFKWRIRSEKLQVMEIKGFLTYLDLNLLRMKIAKNLEDESVLKRMKIALVGPEDVRFNNHFAVGSHLITSKGQMKAGRYNAWISVSELVLRNFKEGRIVATDAKAYVLAHRDLFSETAIKFFESTPLEELEEMWHADGFRLGMRDARFLRLVLVQGMNRAKEGIPAFVESQLTEQGLKDVKILKSSMGALFYVNFNIKDLDRLVELAQGQQPVFDEILVESAAAPGK